MLKQNAKIFFVLHELKHVDDDVARAGVGHDPLYLTHLVDPESPQIGVGICAGLTPKLEIAIMPSHFVEDCELCSLKRSTIAGGYRGILKGEPRFEWRKASLPGFLRGQSGHLPPSIECR